MSTTTIIGIVASAFTGISLLPQLLKLIREKKASDISMVMLVTLLTGLGLWVWYGFRINDWVIVGANSLSLSLNTAIILLNTKYKEKKGDQASSPRPGKE